MVEHPAGTGWRGVYLQALRTFRFPARPSAPVVSISLFHPPSSIFHPPSAFSFSAFQFSAFALGCLVAAATSGSALKFHPSALPATLNPLPQPPAL
jgi:hypothetical protein